MIVLKSKCICILKKLQLYTYFKTMIYIYSKRGGRYGGNQ